MPEGNNTFGSVLHSFVLILIFNETQVYNFPAFTGLRCQGVVPLASFEERAGVNKVIISVRKAVIMLTLFCAPLSTNSLLLWQRPRPFISSCVGPKANETVPLAQ